MKIELTHTVDIDELPSMIIQSIIDDGVQSQQTAFEFIQQLEAEFEDGELTYRLAEHFLRECIRCGMIETKEELKDLFNEVEEELQ